MRSGSRMNKKRCGWCNQDPLYVAYHDTEWGVPIYDDQQLFEFLILEGMQAGLSWFTILKKRKAFRDAFSNFNAKKIVKYDYHQIDLLLNNAGIIRNKLKIQAAIQNAAVFLETQKEWGRFSNYIWNFVDGHPIQNNWENAKQAPIKTNISDAMSKDLKKRGFKFVGSTICYAYMQAVGMVNDHMVTCFRYKELKK
jgi:DNA-3-methyladenine glycosylase I